MLQSCVFKYRVENVIFFRLFYNPIRINVLKFISKKIECLIELENRITLSICVRSIEFRNE